MRPTLILDEDRAAPFAAQNEWSDWLAASTRAYRTLESQARQGLDGLGWMDYPTRIQEEEIRQVVQAAENLRRQVEAVVVVGVGGSYLGAKAAFELLCSSFYNQQPISQRGGPELYFAGHHFSARQLVELMEWLKGKEWGIAVISKSGGTTEPAAAFRLLRQRLEQSCGREKARSRIVAVTDPQRGLLRQQALAEGYALLPVPQDIGGRYSVLTAVGLLPMAIVGLPVSEVLAGARDFSQHLRKVEPEQNMSVRYAAWRSLFYRQGKVLELLVYYEPAFAAFGEWWKQLFGESEGKQGKGLFPVTAQFTTDLHSLGQYIQEGPRHFFTTSLLVQAVARDIAFDLEEVDLDGLNPLAGQGFHQLNSWAAEGALRAHAEGDVPNLVVRMPETVPYYFGQLAYFFQLACAVSASLLEVNPFDQPGVEAYKQHIRTLFGKAGK